MDEGLSQSELARRADIPRTTLRDFENGANITLDTLVKILAQLPNVRSLTIGTAEVRTDGVDLREIRNTVAEWVDNGRRILALLDTALAAPAPRPGGGGATRHEAGLQITPELEARLARLEAEVKGARRIRET